MTTPPLALGTALVILFGATASPQGRSPVEDLLQAGISALNSLNYAKADSIARQMLAMSPRALNATYRRQATMLAAAAAYPDDAAMRKQDVAIELLRPLVRENIDFEMPAELGGAAMDSLVAEIKRTTFAVALQADTMQVVSATEGAQIKFRSTMPAVLQVDIKQAGNEGLVHSASTAPGVEGDVRLPVVRDGVPLLSSGRYAATAIARNLDKTDSILARYAVRVDVPSLSLVPVPVLDSSKLHRERTRLLRMRTVFFGLLAGGVEYGVAYKTRGRQPFSTEIFDCDTIACNLPLCVTSKVPDPAGGFIYDFHQPPCEWNKAPSPLGAVATALVTTTIITLLDRRANRRNIAANASLRLSYEKTRRDAELENGRRWAEHQVRITITLLR